MTTRDDVGRELAEALRHRIRPMRGRDPRDASRASTPLELLFDLTFVIAFGVAAEQLAHGLGEGRIGPAIGAYAFAIFSVTWAWTNSTWFVSAYGNDDVILRVATIVQMAGVVILIFGIPASFEAAADGRNPNNVLLVVGYTVMRLPLVALWLRAAAEDPDRRRTAVAYALSIVLAQLAWIATVAIPLPLAAAVAAIVTLIAVELAAPLVIERALGAPPWNPDHLADRFGLLTLITIGEVLAATTAAVGALVDGSGWSAPAIVVMAAGVVIAAGLWWAYFLIPSKTVLRLHPERTIPWRYAHFLVFGAVAAVGAGLRVAAAAVGEAEISLLGIALALAVPVGALVLLIFATWSVLMRSYDLSHIPLFAACLAPLVAAVALAATAGGEAFDPDGPGALTILIAIVGLVAASCVVEVVGHEAVGFRHTARSLEAA